MQTLVGRKLWIIALLPGYAFGLCAFAVVRFDFCHPLSFLSVFCCTCSLCLYLQDWKGFAQLRGGLNPGLIGGASLPARKLPMVRG